MSTNNKTSDIVKSQLPFFVRNDHQTFATFLEAYYEYLEQSNNSITLGKTTERTKNLLQYMDVDNTLDIFAEELYKKFLKGFPVNTLTNRDLIVKHAKDFYRAKGTEKSFRFLMRVLFDKEIEFYYPKKDVLRASDGKWYIQKSLRISNTELNGSANTDLSAIEKYINRKITGNTSNATATVESIDRFYESGTQVDELVISNISGTFEEGEVVTTSFTDDQDTYEIQSEVFGSVINSITINNPGSGYEIGDPVLILSNVGSGAVASVSRVSDGNLASISVLSGGAGYQANNLLLFTGGGGSGANAKILTVTDDSTVHPNSYILWNSTINLEANTPINNTKYSNLNSSITDPCNNWIQNSLTSFVYTNTGPAASISVITPGSGYTSIPSIGVVANTRIQELGILGRMNLISGGTGYAVGEKIVFENVLGGSGTAGMANVVNVAANGMIRTVQFEAISGHLPGGEGYENALLPTANIQTVAGTGANIVVECILGTNATFLSANSTLGAIERIVITSRGSGYRFTPTVDLTGSGDGTATAEASVIRGLFTYPGRYLNDDGHISSYNFLQDRDYYQNFSYVLKVKESINNYRKILKELVHPAGMKMFGEYTSYDNNASSIPPAAAQTAGQLVFLSKTYTKSMNTINISYDSHGLAANSNVYLEFTSGGTTNTRNGIFTVSSNSTTNYLVTLENNSSYYSTNTSGSVEVGVRSI